MKNYLNFEGLTYFINKLSDKFALQSHTHDEYENKNAFCNIIAGSATISADNPADTFTLEAGDNVTFTTDTTNDKVTISATDTKYTHPTTVGNKHIPIGGSSGQILRWSANGTAAWGEENDTLYEAAGDSLGLVQTGGDVTISSGIITVNNNSHNHTISNISNLQSTLNDKADSVDLTSHTSNTSNPHKVTKSQIGLSNVENKSSATIRSELTKEDVVSALKYTPPEQDTEYIHPVFTNAAQPSGLYKITINSNGHVSSATPIQKTDITALGIPAKDTVATLSSLGITATAAELNKLAGLTATKTELNYVNGVTSNIQTQLDSKSPSKHTHTLSELGAASSGHTHTAEEVGASPDGHGHSNYASSSHNHDDDYATIDHTHSISDISNLQTTLNGKAPTNHTHSEYAESDHTHTKSSLGFSYGTSLPSSGSTGDIFFKY